MESSEVSSQAFSLATLTEDEDKRGEHSSIFVEEEKCSQHEPLPQSTTFTAVLNVANPKIQDGLLSQSDTNSFPNETPSPCSILPHESELRSPTMTSSMTSSASAAECWLSGKLPRLEVSSRPLFQPLVCDNQSPYDNLLSNIDTIINSTKSDALPANSPDTLSPKYDQVFLHRCFGQICDGKKDVDEGTNLQMKSSEKTLLNEAEIASTGSHLITEKSILSDTTTAKLLHSHVPNKESDLAQNKGASFNMGYCNRKHPFWRQSSDGNSRYKADTPTRLTWAEQEARYKDSEDKIEFSDTIRNTPNECCTDHTTLEEIKNLTPLGSITGHEIDIQDEMLNIIKELQRLSAPDESLFGDDELEITNDQALGYIPQLKIKSSSTAYWSDRKDLSTVPEARELKEGASTRKDADPSVIKGTMTSVESPSVSHLLHWSEPETPYGSLSTDSDSVFESVSNLHCNDASQKEMARNQVSRADGSQEWLLVKRRITRNSSNQGLIERAPKSNLDNPSQKKVSFCISSDTLAPQRFYLNEASEFDELKSCTGRNESESNDEEGKFGHSFALSHSAAVPPLEQIVEGMTRDDITSSGNETFFVDDKRGSRCNDNKENRPTSGKLGPNSSTDEFNCSSADGATNMAFVLEVPMIKNIEEEFVDHHENNNNVKKTRLLSRVVEKMKRMKLNKETESETRGSSGELTKPECHTNQQETAPLTCLAANVNKRQYKGTATLATNDDNVGEMTTTLEEGITPLIEQEKTPENSDPDDDTLSLEFFVPGKKKYIRLHRRTFFHYVLKYLIFLFTFVFWVASVSGIGFGVGMLTSSRIVIDDVSDVFLDPYVLLCVVSAIIFVIAYFGCVGALRENICLLKMFHMSLTAVLILEVLLSTLVFLFYTMPEFRMAVKVGPEEVLKKAVKEYFDNELMQNWIDSMQKEFKCCGVSMSDHGYLDWQENVYFNCSPNNPSMYRCSVPLSCCKFEPGEYINYMCGAAIIQQEELQVNHVINTKGCMKSFGEWLARNDAVIGYVALGVIIPQILGVIAARFFVKSLMKRRTSWKQLSDPVKIVDPQSELIVSPLAHVM